MILHLVETVGAVDRYDVRYQKYESNCSIDTNFDSAIVPLTDVAGAIPDSVASGSMSYDFYVNKLSNNAGDETADIHKNGDKYCFAVKAVDAVYASDGTVLVENDGVVLESNEEEMELTEEIILNKDDSYHNIILRDIGDVDGDSKEDYVIADSYYNDGGNRRGRVLIQFSGGVATFEKTGSADFELLGAGVSLDSDFNKDGKKDFAYCDRNGNIFIHNGTGSALNAVADHTFRAKDEATDTNRSMTTGDYNGDGCTDILITAPSQAGSDVGAINRGELYIYYGRGDGSSGCPTSDYDGSSPDLTFEGFQDNDNLGYKGMSYAGDLNNDGYDDFAIGTSTTNLFVLYGNTEEGAFTEYTMSGLQQYPGN